MACQGSGEYIEPGGNSYKGDWADDKCHGKGTFAFASGAMYSGDWVNNLFHGQGKYTFSDGSFYEVGMPTGGSSFGRASQRKRTMSSNPMHRLRCGLMFEVAVGEVQLCLLTRQH